jgi:branched-chain amino acid aminotransferase/para-aminobenzoate synthetase component 1
MKTSPPFSVPVIWLNGHFVPLHEAVISPFDRGLLYGDGLFETMRAEKGRVLYLEKHLERLKRSLAAMRIAVDLSLDWPGILGELLRHNHFLEEPASIKVMVTRGVCQGLGLPTPDAPTVCLTAKGYNPPDPYLYETGWIMHIHREGFSPPLAGHKTLNYLYFTAARQAALDTGAHEAVVLDPQGRITETAAGSILARTGSSWWTPASPYQLPGITLGVISELLAEAGAEVESRTATPDDLLSCRTIWVLNSLMVIMPVARVEKYNVPVPAAREASRLRKQFMERGLKNQPDTSY